MQWLISVPMSSKYAANGPTHALTSAEPPCHQSRPSLDCARYATRKRSVLYLTSPPACRSTMHSWIAARRISSAATVDCTRSRSCAYGWRDFVRPSRFCTAGRPVSPVLSRRASRRYTSAWNTFESGGVGGFSVSVASEPRTDFQSFVISPIRRRNVADFSPSRLFVGADVGGVFCGPLSPALFAWLESGLNS